MAEESIEPRGEWRDDLRAGIVASSNVNLWRGKDSKGVSPSEFMPFVEKKKVEADPGELARKFMRATAMMGGTIWQPNQKKG